MIMFCWRILMSAPSACGAHADRPARSTPGNWSLDEEHRAGAFIASALSSQSLVTLPGAEPSVMDLPSISRVTKLPLEQLKELAKSTPIFAPGVEPLFATGAVTETWAADRPFAQRLTALLGQAAPTSDLRDQIGLERKGRLLARDIAQQVAAEAGNA